MAADVFAWATEFHVERFLLRRAKEVLPSDLSCSEFLQKSQWRGKGLSSKVHPRAMDPFQQKPRSGWGRTISCSSLLYLYVIRH